METGFLPAIRRTVIAATIPHLRPDWLKMKLENFKEIKDKLTALVKKFNQSKDLRKELILRTIAKIDKYFLPCHIVGKILNLNHKFNRQNRLVLLTYS